MVRTSLAISSLALASSVFAQTAIPTPGSAQPMGVQPGGIPVGRQPVQTAPLDPKLVTHLQAWEVRMKAIGNVVCEAEKVSSDTILKRVTEKQVAKIYCMKPNYAFMRLDRAPDMPPDPKDYQTWICDGKSIHQYSGKQSEYSEFKLGPNGNIQGNLLLEFISGAMTANDAVQRFDVKLLKEDTNYVFLEVKPRLQKDREDFEVMTLVFYSPNLPQTHQHMRYLPALVKMTRNQNKEEEVWTFKQPQVNVQGLTPKNFEKQALPAGWRVAPPQGTTTGNNPRVVRP